MNILVTGGCGYTGTLLTNDLVELGHNVTVVDTQWFGNHLKKRKSNYNVKTIYTGKNTLTGGRLLRLKKYFKSNKS